MSDGRHDTDPSHDDGPSHPPLAAGLVMAGIVLLLIVLAVAETLS